MVTTAPGGLFFRDVANRSHFVQPSGTLEEQADGAMVFDGRDQSLALQLSCTYRAVGSAIRIDGTVRDLSHADRAVTVYFTYPVDAVGWLWHDDQRVSRRIQAGEKYGNLVDIGAGTNGMASRYPFACVGGDTEALVLGAPLDVPRLYRFGYDADSRELYAAVDLGLSPDTAKFPSEASFSLVLYRCDPQWGFRSALERYYALFPQCFTKRNAKEGLWMNGTHVDIVEGFEDFGFQFMKPNTNVLFDELHGIYSFIYIEPMSLWLHMLKDMERTEEQALAYLDSMAEADSPAGHAALTSALADVNGEWHMGPANLPTWSGFFFSMNPDPDLIPSPPGRLTQAQRRLRAIEYAVNRAAALHHPAWRNWKDGSQIWQDGYALVPGEGRDGSCAVRMGRTAQEEDVGATQRVVLNQDKPHRLTARVWTRAENVAGEADKNCALYVDAEYTDGTPGWGLFLLPAPTGSHDWELLEQTVTPPKAVRSLAFHLLLRKPHTGAVWFDDAFLGQGDSDENLLQCGDLEPGGEGVEAALDGTYLDTFERWGLERNFRREHWVAADTPLVFDSEGRACELMIFPTLEFAQEVAARMWADGKMTFGNGTPRAFPWGAPWLDVFGHEINWGRDATYSPEPDSVMNYRRAISCQRPYLLLMHTDYEQFKPEWMELLMKRATAYAFFPSPGENYGKGQETYWQSPALYNRDRPLFKKYVPLIKALNAAGWEPITHARSDNPNVYVERFGRPDGPLYLTLFNDSHQRQTATISLDTEALRLAPPPDAVPELLRGESLPLDQGQQLGVELAPEDVKVLHLAG